MGRRQGIALGIAWVASALAACVSFGDLSGGEAADSGADSASTHADAGSDVGFPISKGGCNFATPFGTPQRLDSLDTKFSDQAPRLTSDQLSIFFSSNNLTGGDSGIGIFAATRSTIAAPFGDASFVSALSTPGPAVSQPSVTGDGLTIYFQSQGNKDESGGDKSGTDIYFATRANIDSAFGSPVSVSGVRYATINETPFIRADGNVLYFSSYDTTAGSIPKILRAVGNAGSFGPPSTEDELNSGKPTASPVVTPDDLSIFYTTIAPGGLYEIYKGQRANVTEPFTNLQQVSELTSVGSAPAWVSADACTLYFYQVVGASTTDVDMYFATRPK
ncbi:MAG: hypothetical protein ABI183_21850 [Polyangiaceae bacterium]